MHIPKIALFTLALAPLCNAQVTAGSKAPSQSPAQYTFFDNTDLARFRTQASKPELAVAYEAMAAYSAKSVSGWRKKYPQTDTPRSTADLIAIGLKGENPKDQAPIVATQFALTGDPATGQVLREMLMTRISARRIKFVWRNDGIHEGESTLAFLEAYDIAAAAGVMTDTDKAEVKSEMLKDAHYMEGWSLDNSFSQQYMEYYRTAYCLNFHTFAAGVAGIIGMMYPDAPDSADWIRMAQTQLPEFLFREFAEDGAYGEGSAHYWLPTFNIMLQFIEASRNLGYRDYKADPAFSDAIRRTIEWQMNLTAPDGRTWAIGDSDRDTDGANYLVHAGTLFDDPKAVWVGKSIMQQVDSGIDVRSPYDLLYYDSAQKATKPDTPSVNLPYSGYAIFRSDWSPNANEFGIKYGPTWVGRRENETSPVISGHAHQDALEIELHYKGIPMLVDFGRMGRYQDYDTYGGYMKATVSHNTVGLGNAWGYDREDGKYAEHAKQHSQFLYETPQNDIGRKDILLKAFGDTGQIGIFSAQLNTYDGVSQQRTVVWFRDMGFAILEDRMASGSEQPYEWYLNPIGQPLGDGKTLSFGDDAARLDVLPVLSSDATLQTVRKGDPKLPPYYVGLRPAGQDGVGKNRTCWNDYSLLIEKEKARSANFLNILVPYLPSATPVYEALGRFGEKVSMGDTTVLVAQGGSNNAALATDADFAVVRYDKGTLVSYVMSHGKKLSADGAELASTSLTNANWATLFDYAPIMAVSLVDKRATICLPEYPAERNLIIDYPRVAAGQEAAQPLGVSVSFRVNEKPRRIVALRSDSDMRGLDDPAFDAKTKPWPNDMHQGHYLREVLPFTYDEASVMVTVQMDVRMRQIVWE